MAETNDSALKKPLLEEVAATGAALPGLADAFRGGKTAWDKRLFEKGGAAYRRLLEDDQVQSTFQQRRHAVIAADWSVAPGGDDPRDEEAAEHLSEVLNAISWDRVTDKMLFGVFYGYAVAEVMWAIEDARVVIDRIIVRDRLRFRFDRDGNLRLRETGNPEGRLMPDRKFWTYRAGGDHDDNDYGCGLGYHLYWPVWFKREGLKSWLRGLDKTARPTAVGKFPNGASADDISKLLDTLESYASDTGVAIPESMSIELMQAARSATSDYDTLYNRMDAAISKIVLSQTMTTDSSVSGLGSNQADVHSDVKREVVKADADLLNESFAAQVATWLTQWNFPGAAPPLVKRQTEDEEDLGEAVERDQKLYLMGWAPTEERVSELYGDGYERRSAKGSGEEAGDGDGERRPMPPGFAAPKADGASVEADLERDALDEWAPVVAPLVDPLQAHLDGARGYKTASDGLSAVLADMDEAPLRERLARSGFVARLAATLGAIDDKDDPPADLSEHGKRFFRRGKKKAIAADFEELTLEPLPPVEAIRYFERKGYRIGFDWRDVWQAEHARAFTVAKVTRLDLLESIRTEVDRALRDGLPYESFRKNLTPILQREGWWGVQTVIDPLTGQAVEAELGSPRRLRIIFDTNLRTARAAGRWERIERNKARRPYLRYSQIQRPTRRDEHVPFHGLVRPVDDPVWDRIYPPNGWRCGCSVQALTERQARRRGITPEAESRRILKDQTPYRNKRTGAVTQVTTGVTPGFDYNVGKAHMRGPGDALSSALARAAPEAARETLAEAIAGEVFADFLTNAPRHGAHAVMVMDKARAARAGIPTVVSLAADTLAAQRIRRPDLTDADYRMLPLVGAAPDLVIRADGRAFFIKRDGESWLAAEVSAAGALIDYRRIEADEVRRLERQGRVVLRA